jgi:predicted esterase
MKRLLAGLLVLAGLSALPSPSQAEDTATVQHLTSKAWVYVPKSATASAPLVVLLHGAGGDARRFLDQFKRDADERGVALLSLQSVGRTWPRRPPNDGEADVSDLDAALEQLSKATPFDRHRVVVAGFSDGASYALSLGMAYPAMYRTIIAFSPGYAFAPSDADTSQRIFISHSRRDPVLPAANVREMVEGLESAGYRPEVHWFNGGHEVDPDIKKLALDFALEPTRTPR